MPDDPQPWVLHRECRGCDSFAALDDVGLCAQCAIKLERDLIRQRAWDYSAVAFAVRPEDREDLRAATIAEHGAALELVASDAASARKRRRGRQGRRRRASRRRRGPG
jgi:hypothetical protein